MCQQLGIRCFCRTTTIHAPFLAWRRLPEYRVPSAKGFGDNVTDVEGNAFHFIKATNSRSPNYPFTRIEEFDDIEVRNAWNAELLTDQVSADDFISHMLKTSRDHSRTPMQSGSFA